MATPCPTQKIAEGEKGEAREKAALAVDVEEYERVAAKERQGTRSDIGQKIDTSEAGRATEKAAEKAPTSCACGTHVACMRRHSIEHPTAPV